MNTKLSNKEIENIHSEFESIFSFEEESDEIEIEANLLMAKFLSEVQKKTEQLGVNRKVLASLIQSSPSYLTQIFRGQKPLNFITLAKFQRALNIKFDVTINGNERMSSLIDDAHLIEHLNKWFADQNKGEYFKIVKNLNCNEGIHDSYKPSKKTNHRVA